MAKNIELAIAMTAAMIPCFVLANEVGPDEFVKSGAGFVTGGIVLAIYRMWQTGREH